MGKVVKPKLDFPVPDETWDRVAQNQRESLGIIATKLDNHESLNSVESMFAAAACRALAKQIPLKQPKKKGAKPRIDGSLAAIQAAAGLSYAQIAGIHSNTDLEGITEQAVGRAVKRNGRHKAAESLLPISGVTVDLKK